MFRRSMLSLVAVSLLLFVPLSSQAVEPDAGILTRYLPKEVKDLKNLRPSVLVVIQVLDTMTASESAVATSAKLSASWPVRKLALAKTKLDVTVMTEQKNWRGRVKVALTMPCELGYVLDLGSLQRQAFQFDRNRKTLRVRISEQDLQIDSVEPVLPALEVQEKYTWARFRMIDSKEGQKQQLRLLKEDFPERARALAQDHKTTVVKQAREELQQFLRELFRLADTDLEVICE